MSAGVVVGVARPPHGGAITHAEHFLEGDSMSIAENAERKPGVRAVREEELRTLWNTKQGQRQVLNLFWTNRESQKPLQAGESVIQLILDHEFGPLPV
jgi:hypothetical protein